MYTIDEVKQRINDKIVPLSKIRIKHCIGKIFGLYDITRINNCNIQSELEKNSLIDEIFNHDFGSEELLIIESNMDSMISKIEIQKNKDGSYYCI